ncbi:MAG: sugar phosphate isomerase/epimerase [Candidatus Sumerlaeales bacterium]|nr:sugar phosphate isomerase/epimerase [Candidatus Sumerlaeales bacterium]
MYDLGLIIHYDERHLRLVKNLHMSSVELQVFPDSALSKEQGAGPAEWREAREYLASLGTKVGCLGFYKNMLDPDLAVRQGYLDHIESMFDIAAAFGTNIIGCFAGRQPELSIDENIPEFARVWAPLAKKAEDRGIKFAFENCPMFHGHPFRGINIACTPDGWRQMFEAVPSRALGLEFDPSHLICQGIDPVAQIYAFADRIYMFHAKDAELFPDKIQKYGFLDGRSMCHRMPGCGTGDWRAMLNALRTIGYAGPLHIEGWHDPQFHEATNPEIALQKEEEGLRIAMNTLRFFG